MPKETEPQRRLTARGAAMRGRLIEVAAALIYEKGASRTSLDDVLEKSGASKSQLYHYFADKDALILGVIRWQIERVLALQQPHLAQLDSLEALWRWRDAVLALATAAPGLRGCPLGSLANELAGRFENARSLLAGGFDRWREALEAGLGAMRARGELAGSANPRELALAILAALQGGLLLAKTAQTIEPLEAALEMALEHVARHATRKSARKGGAAAARSSPEPRRP
ncbi:TetR/AcrR family transcriptional regulator [Methylacidimicrobium sp. B4]|uniref:TetR/AcrR family transcriptional regulator n=1 Tax=Methylacidimicrobium sp. B4 TaxID=2796139 RepID=UPI001A8E7285|nr:TetR/AcrR family transcriptional regulator [Methylacidimicrobium sp. B4]QSR84156.1 TetR/AcrR family transcriptional regulator [Methylacidimicrobium sp. B4]